MHTAEWIELDKQWRQRSKLMFQRCVKEPDLTKAQFVWEAACLSEKKRLEWKSECLGDSEQEEIIKAFATVNDQCAFFTLDGSQLPVLAKQTYN